MDVCSAQCRRTRRPLTARCRGVCFIRWTSADFIKIISAKIVLGM